MSPGFYSRSNRATGKPPNSFCRWYEQLRKLAAAKLALETPGQTLQVWMQNEGEGIPFEQGTPITVHFPTDALRVLLDTGSLQELHRMEEPLAAP